MSAPDTSDDQKLASFYLERGRAAFHIYRWTQAMEDLRNAFRHAKKAGIQDHRFLKWLGRMEAWAGNFNFGIELLERSLRIKEGCGTYATLARAYIMAGDFEKAKRTVNKGTAVCSSNQDVGSRFCVSHMAGHFLYAQGKYAEAEEKFRYLSSLQFSPGTAILAKTWLAQSLMKQSRLIEAELEVRQAVKESIALAGSDSGITAVHVADLAEILQAQGRLQDAEKLIKTAIRIKASGDISSETIFMDEIHWRHGSVLADQGKYGEAVTEFEFAKAILHHDQYRYGKGFALNPNVMLSLIKTDRTEEAMELISSVYQMYHRNIGEDNYLTSEILGLRGMAKFKIKKLEQAVKDFSEAIPILLEANIPRKKDFSSKQRFKIILETYMELLALIHGSRLERELGINASGEAFRLADAIRGHVVQSALGASGARAAAADPELSDIVRKEQDASQQIDALESMLTNTLAAPEDQRNPTAINQLTNNIDTLRKAQNALQGEIKVRFPKYSDFVNQRPGTIALTQEHLLPGESLIAIYSTDNHTYIWAIPAQGKVRFAVVNLGKKELSQRVAHLRMALHPEPETFADIPEFDISQAYELYSKLLKPIDEGRVNAKDLIIVATGPLGQLPFSVLPTSHVERGRDDKELFGNYRKIPWLIRKISITRLPSVSSFITLRKLPGGDPGRKAFVGFGDPLFNKAQLAQAEREKEESVMMLASQGGRLDIRGLRITKEGNLDNPKIVSCTISNLNRLPDTSAEIRKIAEALGAEPDRDIFLGIRASEHQVKNMGLSDRKVIAFATHALLPGDLDGLDQPALALSAPSVTGDYEDGLLTMGEILGLKLNADWIVLSACNTGAAEGKGAEAISGLGRAFFYAGTRAMLVSMWPVETTSAMELTTGLFEHQKKDPSLSRSQALRESMLDLMDSPGYIDRETGKIVASYAHPFFWAPFIVVGDGGY